MHTAELSAAWDGSKSAGDTDDTASECMNYLVKELFRYGHFGLICELHWGSLQPQVETYILWQAGNAAIVQGDSSNASATRYYDLLFAFYVRNQGLASAASALYAFALRSQLTLSTSKAAFEAQRNALNAACNALQALPPENRWFVHKLHTKRPKSSSLKTPEHAKVVPFTRVVTLEDMKCDLSVLDGKLHLLTLGCSEGMLLSTMDGDEVIALLVDAVNTATKHEVQHRLSVGGLDYTVSRSQLTLRESGGYNVEFDEIVGSVLR
uniref:NUP160 middle TPR domain-containing protein n=1 Tax=Hyaloperonospora arabidopsidis (strain Emoy2) TaxID=559515 RepID=M4C5Z3_HYAAE